ncbi:hypothetical protein HMN09_01221700 [Mycena chlorophos]|uniref:ER membrane protein complex subunit 10 n=1 Tax=Mycena chlorophos TaxID=658473 RepID=A0A8H6S5E5_MYCCL|nr:hypothetical protein HMN09_01221700 [Mycena chlorophos]
MFGAVLLAAVALPTTFAAQYRVFHRLYQPALPESAFTPRGLIHVDAGAVSFDHSLTFVEDLTQLSNELQTVNDTLYQVALELDGANPGQWDIVSAVKVCHLDQATTERFILQTTRAGQPYALDYFVAPIPNNGACPEKAQTPLLAFASGLPLLNSTVELRASRTPPELELRVPPPLTAEGEPIAPVPERTFFQKYWMYGAAILIALLLSGGPEEEQKK